jgi:hypothetical protein
MYYQSVKILHTVYLLINNKFKIKAFNKMNKKIASLAVAALFSFSALSANAAISDQKFSTAQIFDVQWYIQNNVLNASGFDYLFASVDASGNYEAAFTPPNYSIGTAARLGADDYAAFNSNGRYISFVDYTNVPEANRVTNTYGLAVFNNDNSVYRWINYTGEVTALTSGATFYNGDGLWGTLFTTAQGYNLGDSGSWEITQENPTYSALQAFVPLTTNALQSGETVAAVPEADTSAMLLMGAGVMGFIARRRKQAAA